MLAIRSAQSTPYFSHYESDGYYGEDQGYEPYERQPSYDFVESRPAYPSYDQYAEYSAPAMMYAAEPDEPMFFLVNEGAAAAGSSTDSGESTTGGSATRGGIYHSGR